jgi:hypothetical protein
LLGIASALLSQRAIRGTVGRREATRGIVADNLLTAGIALRAVRQADGLFTVLI